MANTLILTQKADALRAINLIKEKQCGKIKGQTVSDGSAQRKHFTKEEAASPTVSTDALIITLPSMQSKNVM